MGLVTPSYRVYRACIRFVRVVTILFLFCSKFATADGAYASYQAQVVDSNILLGILARVLDKLVSGTYAHREISHALSKAYLCNHRDGEIQLDERCCTERWDVVGWFCSHKLHT